MLGMVFTCFSDLVIEKFGLEQWAELLDEVKPKSGGVYTSGAKYDDEELFALVTELSKKTGVPTTDLIRAFGEYIFPSLIKALKLPDATMSSLKNFLMDIESVIHKDVKRLYPDTYLPVIDFEDPGDEQHLVLLYRSKRKLCPLAEGLIFGASAHFGVETTIEHKLCMHDGHDHCRLELTFKG